ncbi:C-type lectin domain family 4 member E-like [Menidia menidia]
MDEEEVSYSTVVFKGGQPPKVVQREEETVYADVRRKDPAADAPTKLQTPADFSPKTQEKAEAGAAADSRLFLLLAFLVILSVLLVAGIAVIIYIGLTMREQQASISSITAEKELWENRTQELSGVMDRQKIMLDQQKSLLDVIMTFENFPVSEYCPDRGNLSGCGPCRSGWVLYGGSCYLFQDSDWRPWSESLEFCQKLNAHLVVIGNQQEQEFISGRIEFYFDEYHGYHIGLREENGKWIWVNGQEDTLGFWIKGPFGESGPHTLMIPGRNFTENWDKTDAGFKNRFICEDERVFLIS